MSSAADSLDEIATLRIELADTDPLILHQVEVPTSIALKGLHEVVGGRHGLARAASVVRASSEPSPFHLKGFGPAL